MKKHSDSKDCKAAHSDKGVGDKPGWRVGRGSFNRLCVLIELSVALEQETHIYKVSDNNGKPYFFSSIMRGPVLMGMWSTASLE